MRWPSSLTIEGDGSKHKLKAAQLISLPSSGQARLDAGENLVLINLLRFEDDPQDLMAIPGALRADPGKVRHRTRIVLPEGMDLVLYCESKDSFLSARVASALRKTNPSAGRWVDAWKARGFPLDTVTTELAERIAEMKRLGIELIPSPWSPPPSETTPAPD
ncbi:MAG: hypothetical protein ABSB39_24450 [Candidatus Sulfotelmatobacter sp.]|jgi:hypothetical protein